MLVDLYQPIGHVTRGGLVGLKGSVCDPADHLAREGLLPGAAVTGWDDDQTRMDIVAYVHRAEVRRVVGDEYEPFAVDELPECGVADPEDTPVAVAGPFEPQLVSYLYQRW